MKKKLISLLLLSFVWIFALCACGNRQTEVEQTPAVPAESATPDSEPTTEPTAELPPEPTPEPTAEPTTELPPESTPEPTAEPTTELTPEPTPKPTTEPTAEPAIEPSTEPVVAPKPVSSEIPEPKENTEPVTSSADQIPEFDLAAQKPSDAIGDGATGIDPSDPYYGCAGYEGPKEGYVFVPNIGYRLKEVNDQMVQNLEDAETKEPNYYDFSGHMRAWEDLGLSGTGAFMDYEGWCADHIDYVNEICKEWGITFEKYMEYNHNVTELGGS